MKTREQIVEWAQSVLDQVCEAGLEAERLEHDANRIGDKALAAELCRFQDPASSRSRELGPTYRRADQNRLTGKPVGAVARLNQILS